VNGPSSTSDVTDENQGTTADDRDDGVDPATAFSALGHGVRVDVLRELHAHRQETGEETVGFADLRRRVGLRDSGQFRYHLNELRDHFVERTDDGYRLTRPGERVVAAIVAGTYETAPSLGPVPVDDCPLCGAAAAARYEDGHCAVTCEDDHVLFTWTVPPNAAADRSLSDLVELSELLARQSIERAQTGVCPECFDPVDPTVDVDPPVPVFRACCDTCGLGVVGPVGFCLLTDPAVAAACREGGLTLDDQHLWELPFVADASATSVRSEDPLRVAVAVPLPDGDLEVTLDERGTVADVDRHE